tara:strand:- start:14492 stop:14938 length:447 start_codon:yes stop_codon:yes gene_type:complete
MKYKVLKFLIHKGSVFMLCSLLLGCQLQSKDGPKDVFNAFIDAIYKKDKVAILSFIHPDSRDVFSSELGKQIKWYESLKNNTELSEPKFLKLDWINRGQTVKVVYTHSGDFEDYLPMILEGNKWWVDLRNNQKLPNSLNTIPRFVPGQ